MRVPRPGLWAERSREQSISWGDAGLSFADSRSLLRWLDEIRDACGAFERVTLGYLAWIGAVLIRFHRTIPHAAAHLAVNIAIAVGIAGLAWSAARSRSFIVRFARCWYPLPLYIFFFEELGGLVHAIFPGWFDRWLIAFDYNFAGVHPSIWLSRFASPALNDAMQFAYMTYFLYLAILPAILYAQKDRVAFWTVMTSTAVAHYSVYVIAVLLPVESPYYSLAALQTKTLSGSYGTALIEFIERFGRVHGAAFPSAHVAGSMVAILASYRYRKWLFWVCLPFFVGMCISTVYGRYHYMADVLGGIAVGTIGFSVGTWLMRRTGALPEAEASSCE
jgi:membrane-associated phospholipid phosphatase